MEFNQQNENHINPLAWLALLALGVTLFGCTAASQSPSGGLTPAYGATINPSATSGATVDGSSGYAGQTPTADGTNQTASDLNMGGVNDSDLQYVQ
ncbi:Uncharacterised protein [uncultured archaeon]|nr:Uncharacterised protein [uncultured archaeon]